MKRMIITTILLTLVAVSCHNELAPEIDPVEEMVDITVEAVVNDEDASTRTSLGGSNADSFREVLWDKGDEIAFFADGASSFSKFVNLNEEDAQPTAVFAGSVQESEDYAAFYPYSSVKSLGSGKVYFTLPNIQPYEQDGFADEMSPMIGHLADGTLSFKNLCGILALNLVGNGKVSSITFRGYDSYGNQIPVAGDAIIDYRSSSVPIIDMCDAQDYSVTLDCADGVLLSETVPSCFYIVLPPGEYHNFELDISLTDGREMNKKGTKPLYIKRSDIARTTVLAVTGTVNLSKNGTANCYIVSEPGCYKFKSVKGNSNTSVGNVASVAVLWESFGSSSIPKVGDLVTDISYDNGYVFFSTPDMFKEGNAVIAAKDDSGLILWSWHIWLTDYPSEQAYNNNAGIMMDRNIGATDYGAGYLNSLGLLYQWGRKDPFLGPSSINGTSRAKSTATWPSTMSSNVSVGTIDYTISHPMVFITDNSFNYDWYYTGSNTTNTTRWGSNKTIYDPCPTGWRVPDGGKYSGVWAKSCQSLKGHSFDKYDKGMNFSGKFGIDDLIWYPAVGVIDSSSGSLSSVGDCAYYWSAGITGNYAYFMFFNLYGTVDLYGSGRASAEGCSVRCQKE